LHCVSGVLVRHKRPHNAGRKTVRIATADLPVWIRAPKSGVEFYSGQSRAKLYDWAAKGYIRSVGIRERGVSRGIRVFHLGSILDFIARCEAECVTPKDGDNRAHGGKTE
jgi:hypothetical protein